MGLKKAVLFERVAKTIQITETGLVVSSFQSLKERRKLLQSSFQEFREICCISRGCLEVYTMHCTRDWMKPINKCVQALEMKLKKPSKSKGNNQSSTRIEVNHKIKGMDLSWKQYKYMNHAMKARSRKNIRRKFWTLGQTKWEHIISKHACNVSLAPWMQFDSIYNYEISWVAVLVCEQFVTDWRNVNYARNIRNEMPVAAVRAREKRTNPSIPWPWATVLAKISNPRMEQPTVPKANI